MVHMRRRKSIILIILCLALFGIFTAFGGLRPVEEGAVSNPIESSAILLPAGADDAEDQPENASMRWFKSPSPAKPKGVALVIHGLNLRPDKMNSIIDNLTRT